MESRVCKSFTLKRPFNGLPTEDDFDVKETLIPPCIDEEFIIESHFLSVDPYMRAYSNQLKIGSNMLGAGVGIVVESKNTEYPVGSVIQGQFGWSTHTIASPTSVKTKFLRKVTTDLEISHALGVLGLTGLTAYFGFLDICTPKAGETVFVNTAAGAVGSIVGQIAKIKGCHVVGCAGSKAKVDYLKELGFDGTFNYKEVNLDKTLKELCPKGIDCFFDNVGGEMFDITMQHMNRSGRVSLCGCISIYNSSDPSSVKGRCIHFDVIPKELKVQGFMTPSFYKRYDEASQQLEQWIKEGKIKAREHVVNGFENMPKAFIGLFKGENIGKMVVKVK